MTRNFMDERYWSIRELAYASGKSIHCLRQAVHRQQLLATKFGNEYLIREQDFLDYLEVYDTQKYFEWYDDVCTC